MNADTIQIDATTWRFEDQGVRFFLLIGTKEALLIDTGMNVRGVREIARNLTALPLKLLNTHADPDHTGDNEAFESFFMSPAESGNYYDIHHKTGTIVPVREGDRLDLGNRPLEIIDLPGHTPGSIAVLDESNRVLYGGDAIQDGNIFMFGARRNMRDYIQSLQKLNRYMDRFDIVYPSHGSFPVSPNLIHSLCEGATRVLAGEVPGETVSFMGRKIIRYDVGCAAFLGDA